MIDQKKVAVAVLKREPNFMDIDMREIATEIGVPVARVKDILSGLGASIYDGYLFGCNQQTLDRLKAA